MRRRSGWHQVKNSVVRHIFPDGTIARPSVGIKRDSQSRLQLSGHALSPYGPTVRFVPQTSPANKQKRARGSFLFVRVPSVGIEPTLTA